MTNSPVKRVGVIGGGQLAWMMAGAAKTLDLQLIVQTPNADDPAVSSADKIIQAPIDDVAATAELALNCDVITLENEFIPLDALQTLAQRGVCFRPDLDALASLLDKYHQRSYLHDIGLPVPQFRLLEASDLKIALQQQKFPLVLKARRHGYDGYGTFIVKSQADFLKLWERLQPPSMLLERFVPFEKELAIMAARGATGEIALYPVVETQQEEQVCRRVIAPARVSAKVRANVEEIARILLENLGAIGIFGIELFLTRGGELLVNEIAPRTHNSGHYTLDACDISQFEMHLRSVAGLPLGVPQLNCAGAVMVNLLGYEHSASDYLEKRGKIDEIPGVIVHWYGKTESRPGRKLGHVTVRLGEEEMGNANAIAKHSRDEIARQIETLWYGNSQ
ncbi:MAG: 5-(carboxyamino)imidazole ribonucleotide synthase [Cyanobacteriota bacterium]|nr:5-(carboxyamino)imidazole ribonucleotide synthase [Cyanobacteriota bacterium]